MARQFDSHGYRDAVNRAREYIFAGDIFQVNLSQRLMRRATCDSLDLYLSLRQANAAPFAGYFNLGTAQVVCSSPERFLQVHDRRVETRPIKGTRKQTGDPVIDQSLSQEMQRSPKDRAENVMIVDLLRNDLSRVCQPESVCVPQLCEVEAFPGVLHLVSAVEGELAVDAGLTDLIAATFPGGSITGAPKVRAMEIISELEPTVRGAYCGSMGYLSFDGSMDLNILIRTITASRGWWQFQVGGGIVADSVAEAEEEETWTKAAVWWPRSLGRLGEDHRQDAYATNGCSVSWGSQARCLCHVRWLEARLGSDRRGKRYREGRLRLRGGIAPRTLGRTYGELQRSCCR